MKKKKVEAMLKELGMSIHEITLPNELSKITNYMEKLKCISINSIIKDALDYLYENSSEYKDLYEVIKKKMEEDPEF